MGAAYHKLILVCLTGHTKGSFALTQRKYDMLVCLIIIISAAIIATGVPVAVVFGLINIALAWAYRAKRGQVAA